MSETLSFFGAAETVTGSKYLLEIDENKYLIDAGLFQGERTWREKNWSKLSYNPSDIKGVLLTHAHVDHTGFLPRLVKLGLNCPVYCTKATADLCNVILPDSGRLQEEEADFRRSTGRSRHSPPLPLYTEEDAKEALKLLHPIKFNTATDIGGDFYAEWFVTGHILGAGGINVTTKNYSITFSGDIGRYAVPILHDPVGTKLGRLLLIESTYGDRLHGDDQIDLKLAEIINKTAKRGGTIVIPSFAVGRAQHILYVLRELKQKRLIPDIPVIIDSPMAVDATQIYNNNSDLFDPPARAIIAGKQSPFQFSKLRFVRDSMESKSLNKVSEPMIIISASGMLTGGRILHHLYHRISSPLNTILFVGYQPPGGRGAWIKSGATSLRLLGEEVPIRAEIAEISGLSAHGDQQELLRWLGTCTGTPQKVAVVHGEPESARVFAGKVKDLFGWETFLPKYTERIILIK